MWLLRKKIKEEKQPERPAQSMTDEEYQRELAFYAYASSLNTIRECQDIKQGY